MRISRRYVVEDYTRLAFTAEDDWRTAIAILRDRFETRYLEHVRALLQRPTSGFAIEKEAEGLLDGLLTGGVR